MISARARRENDATNVEQKFPTVKLIGNYHLFECQPSVARHWKCVVLCGRICTFTLQTVVDLQQFREASLVCRSCVVRRFVSFPFDQSHWLALAVHLGRPHERSVRRHCGVPKFVVLKWEIVAAEGRPSSLLRVWQ